MMMIMVLVSGDNSDDDCHEYLVQKSCDLSRVPSSRRNRFDLKKASI